MLWAWALACRLSALQTPPGWCPPSGPERRGTSRPAPTAIRYVGQRLLSHITDKIRRRAEHRRLAQEPTLASMIPVKTSCAVSLAASLSVAGC